MDIKTVQGTVSQEQFDYIKGVKDECGLTWNEFVLEAARCLEQHYESE